MNDIEAILRIILILVLVIGLAFSFLYLVILLKGISGLMLNVKKTSDKVVEIINKPEDVKTYIEDMALTTIDKVVEQQSIKIKQFISSNVLASILKRLGRT